MKKHFLLILFTCFYGIVYSQSNALIQPGTKAPSFVLSLEQNAIRGFAMPYQNKVVLLHFWNTNSEAAKQSNKYLKRLLDRYKDSEYINADGFEVVAIAVQTDRISWKESIARDSLYGFSNGIALKGFSDDACQKFGVNKIPTDILIDELGTVIAIDPKIIDIENALDNKKNLQPVKRDIHGILAQASDKKEISQFTKVFLFNHYGDSISYTRTNNKGEFEFHEIKLNQDFILKVDNQIDILTSDPITLYSVAGDLIMEGKTNANGFVFYIPSKLSVALVKDDSSHSVKSNPLEISFIKHFEFKNQYNSLSIKDIQEMETILNLLSKNKNSILEFVTHTDSRLDAQTAKTITDKQAATIKSYLQKKGIQISRIRGFSRGNVLPKQACANPQLCSDEENYANRRVEFSILKN